MTLPCKTSRDGNSSSTSAAPSIQGKSSSFLCCCDSRPPIATTCVLCRVAELFVWQRAVACWQKKAQGSQFARGEQAIQTGGRMDGQTERKKERKKEQQSIVGHLKSVTHHRFVEQSFFVGIGKWWGEGIGTHFFSTSMGGVCSCTWVKPGRFGSFFVLCFLALGGHCLQMLCLPGFGTHANTQNLPHFRAFPASIQEHSPPKCLFFHCKR